MENDINLSGEMQEVAEPVEDVIDTPTGEETSGEMQEVAEPAQDEPTEERRTAADAAFAEMRRQLQNSENEKGAANEQLNRARGILARFGFDGETLDDVFDAADANLTGQDVASVRQARVERQQKAGREANLQREVEHYRRLEAKRRMNEDLKAIRKVDPTVKSLNDLGDDYFKLIGAGIDGVTAFNAIKAKGEATKKDTPPVIGRINSRTTEEKEFFTDKELDALSAKDLDDPDVFEKAMKSLSKKK